MPSPWKLVGYFFHDRGVEVQKSILGFLGEILYSVLRASKNSVDEDQQQELFTIMYPVHLEVGRRYQSARGGEDDIFPWDQRDMQEALRLILIKSQQPLNLCLFIDALDEHGGKHRELLEVLLAFTNFCENTLVKIRLCVAGRPENVFKDAFRCFPGFAIHEYTKQDIRHYAEHRICGESETMLTETDGQNLESLIESLVDTVVHKAQDSFL